ncbi:MAG: recombination regulator RecX [Treponema sp.]|jgi:regulatory protein|nr:recombination regulator RecX [Treponema sp.]
MTIVSIKSGTGEELKKIELSDGSLFWFKTCYLPPLFNDELYTAGKAEGREISADEDRAFRFASGCLRAEKAALRLIARAEQAVFGISRKLERRGHESACVDAVVSRLVELELLDDRRFARLWLESRLCCRVSSPRRLLAALCGRGIDRHAAETVLKNCLDGEHEADLLNRYVNRKGLSVPEKTDPRSFRYLLKGEGFSAPAIQQYLEEHGI